MAQSKQHRLVRSLRHEMNRLRQEVKLTQDELDNHRRRPPPTVVPAWTKTRSWFFPIGNAHAALLQLEEAREVRRRCEVVETCLKWASKSSHDAGIWGGLSEDERHALGRRNARTSRISHLTISSRN